MLRVSHLNLNSLNVKFEVVEVAEALAWLVAAVEPIRNSVLQTVQLFSRLSVNSSVNPLCASGSRFVLIFLTWTLERFQS